MYFHSKNRKSERKRPYFTAVTIHCVCQKIRWMFRVLETYNFGTFTFPVSIVYHRVEWNFFQTVQEEKGKFPSFISHSIAIINGIYFLPKSCDNKEFMTCGYYNQIPLLILCNLIISTQKNRMNHNILINGNFLNFKST